MLWSRTYSTLRMTRIQNDGKDHPKSWMMFLEGVI